MKMPGAPGILLPPGKSPVHPVRVPILYYHRVEKNIDPAKGVSPADFDAQMAFLSRKGFQAVTLEALADYFLSGRPLPSRPVVITFDDGYLDNYLNAYPILKRWGFTATVFVVSAYIGRASAWEGCRGKDVAPLMSLENIRTLLADGYHFGGHTRTHQKLTALKAGDAQGEVEGGKKELEDLLQIPVRSFAYPFGDFNPQTVAIVRQAGFSAARTVDTDNTHCREDLLRLRCVKVNGKVPLYKFKYYLTRLYHLETVWHERRKQRA